MITWGMFYVFLFFYRCLFSVFGAAFVLLFTSFLGDANQYQKRGFSFSGNWYRDPTVITENVGAVFSSMFLGNPYLINIGYQALAFYGIYRLLESCEPVTRRKLAVLSLFPSFSIWTSVASKEAILTFALGIIGSYFVMMYRGRPRLRVSHIVAAAIVAIFKAHYGVALLFFYVVTILAGRARKKTLLVFVVGLVSLVPLYIFREDINALSFDVLPHFEGVASGRSTREPFWVDDYDVFSKSGEGMFVGFFGPTLNEAISGRTLQAISFTESAVMVAVLLFFLVQRLPTLPAYNLLLLLFTGFWILFPNYPFGIMNPGSAVRYRSGYLIFLFTVVAILSSRALYVGWKSRYESRQLDS